eukprot:1864440-Rhodomonas_salina.1
MPPCWALGFRTAGRQSLACSLPGQGPSGAPSLTEQERCSGSRHQRVAVVRRPAATAAWEAGSEPGGCRLDRECPGSDQT